jgi:D-alanine-D-alanine ligase
MKTSLIEQAQAMSGEQFGKVAVLLGGTSAEREVSLASGKAILEALLAGGIDAHAFDPMHQSITELKSESFDRVFIALHGRGGEDGSIQGALEQMHIPYTGSGVTGSALAIDKILSKFIWHARNLPTATYEVIHQAEFDNSENTCAEILVGLGGHVMVKPSLEGSSLGMADASTPLALLQAIQNAFVYDSHILIETFIDGPEYTVAILGDQALPSIRMKAANGFYDYAAKYQTNTTEYFCPSGLDEQKEAQIQTLALNAFKALQGTGWGRIDLMEDMHGAFYLLECNTVPGMTEKSLVPKAARQADLSFEELVKVILSSSLQQ